MLENWYEHYGFLGAMLLSVVLVLTFFTWIAALSGVLSMEKLPRGVKFLLSGLLVIFPPASIPFLAYQTVYQYAQNRRAERQFRLRRRGACRA